MEHEATVRLGFFLGVFTLVALWEAALPRRVLNTSKTVRWISNVGVVLIDTMAVRLLFPVLAVNVAVMARQNGWGLLNYLDMPSVLSVVAGVLVLDLIVYLQHVMFHTVPALWRLHMMHHADLDIDVTTGFRFHPVEIVISMVIKLTAVAALIPSLLAVTIRETNSNFGFNFPWWDRLLGTYRAQPAAGHEGMTIGLSQFRDPKRNNLLWMLALPFIGNPGSYAINRRGADPDRLKK